MWVLSPFFRRKDGYTLLQVPQARRDNKYSFFSFMRTSMWITWAIESIKRYQAYSSDQDKSLCRSYGAQEEVLPNFTHKFQAKTFRRLTSNIQIRTSFQSNLGTWKRRDVEMPRTSEMGQHCSLPIEWPVVPVFLGLRGIPACGNSSANARKLPEKRGYIGHSIYQRTEICFELLETPRTSCFTSRFSSLLISLASIFLQHSHGDGGLRIKLYVTFWDFLVALVQKKEIFGFLQRVINLLPPKQN